MSNKTPAVKKAKTESALKRAPSRTKLFLAVVIVSCMSLVVLGLLNNNQDNKYSQGNPASYCLALPKENISSESSPKCAAMLELVSTPEARALGLSGRESLASSKGMLFEFESPGSQCMWMKDMKFPIDMIWVDARYEILKIESSVSPNTYPESFCVDNSKIVLELNAGSAKRLDLQAGDKIGFPVVD